jgi:uncharacterized protein (UPF0147 family)
MSTAKVKIDTEKYMTPGEVEKLQYPKPPKPSKSEYISEPEMKSDLEYPTKKMATEEFKFKIDEVITPGEVEKLVFDKPVKFPDEGDVKVTVDTKLPKNYKPEGEKGGIQKPKEFSVGESQPAEKIDISKYFLSFEKAKPFQKQFSKKDLKRKASGEQNVVALPDVIGYTVLSLLKFAKEEPEQFKKLASIVETSQFLTPEEAAVRKEAMLQKMAGRTLEEWLKVLKEKKVPRKIRRQFKHIWESALERGESEEYAARAAIDILPKRALEKPTEYHGKEKTGPVSKKGGLDEDIQEKQKQIAELQEKIADLQKDLAELQAKKAEEASKVTV